MSDIKMSDERRLQKRFKAAEGAFAALVDQESRLGQIKDISSDGLSFRYIDSHEDKVPFKIISDFKIESEFSFSTVNMRQIGLEFGDLTAGQRDRLERFIKHHTVGEAE
jgi:hypothetical protein